MLQWPNLAIFGENLPVI